MTVSELLTAILRAYPGASPEALETFKPVFRARFDRREGPHLAQAFTDTLASFKPTARQPFPIPADIEAHMPVIHATSDSGGSIRKLLEDRKARALVAYADWYRGQGLKIKSARPRPVFDACVLEAVALSGIRSPLILKADEIALCEQRALSAARVAKFGRLPVKTEEWESQRAQILADWHSGKAEAA
jgi:hypothetical protein